MFTLKDKNRQTHNKRLEMLTFYLSFSLLARDQFLVGEKGGESPTCHTENNPAARMPSTRPQSSSLGGPESAKDARLHG